MGAITACQVPIKPPPHLCTSSVGRAAHSPLTAVAAPPHAPHPPRSSPRSFALGSIWAGIHTSPPPQACTPQATTHLRGLSRALHGHLWERAANTHDRPYYAGTTGIAPAPSDCLTRLPSARCFSNTNTALLIWYATIPTPLLAPPCPTSHAHNCNSLSPPRQPSNTNSRSFGS